MDGSVVGALIGVGGLVATGGVGWTVRAVTGRIDHWRHQVEILRQRLEDQKDAFERALDAKDDTIRELSSQRDRLMVSADITDKLFKQLSAAQIPGRGANTS